MGSRRPPADDAARAAVARGLAELHDPIGLAHRYLRHRGLDRGPDRDDLLDVAISSIVESAISWHPGAGRSMLSWAWMHLDRDMYRANGRRWSERAELGAGADLCDEAWELADDDRAPRTVHGAPRARWLEYDPGLDAYHQVELRVDLQRWADLAELTPLMRWLVTYYALHHGTIYRYTAGQGLSTPMQTGAFATCRLAFKHMRTAAITGRRRDDRWTQARAGSSPGRRSWYETLLARLPTGAGRGVPA